jgi:hypothetical protein
MTELASIPSGNTERISGFVEGANQMIANMPNSTGNDPMKIELEFRDTGNCHIWLVTGRWQEVNGEPCEVYDSLPWDTH